MEIPFEERDGRRRRREVATVVEVPADDLEGRNRCRVVDAVVETTDRSSRGETKT